jgi:hypothetical protein
METVDIAESLYQVDETNLSHHMKVALDIAAYCLKSFDIQGQTHFDFTLSVPPIYTRKFESMTVGHYDADLGAMNTKIQGLLDIHIPDHRYPPLDNKNRFLRAKLTRRLFNVLENHPALIDTGMITAAQGVLKTLDPSVDWTLTSTFQINTDVWDWYHHLTEGSVELFKFILNDPVPIFKKSPSFSYFKAYGLFNVPYKTTPLGFEDSLTDQMAAFYASDYTSNGTVLHLQGQIAKYVLTPNFKDFHYTHQIYLKSLHKSLYKSMDSFQGWDADLKSTEKKFKKKIKPILKRLLKRSQLQTVCPRLEIDPKHVHTAWLCFLTTLKSLKDDVLKLDFSHPFYALMDVLLWDIWHTPLPFWNDKVRDSLWQAKFRQVSREWDIDFDQSLLP